MSKRQSATVFSLRPAAALPAVDVYDFATLQTCAESPRSPTAGATLVPHRQRRASRYGPVRRRDRAGAANSGTPSVGLLEGSTWLGKPRRSVQCRVCDATAARRASPHWRAPISTSTAARLPIPGKHT